MAFICRWRHADADLLLDAMPTEAAILGFASRWQGAAIPHAMARALASGAIIRAVSPPYLVATKLEAFRGRGCGDFLGSRDLGDIIGFRDGLFGALRPDTASQDRADAVVLPALRAIASMR